MWWCTKKNKVKVQHMDFVGVLEVRFGHIAHFETLSLETHEVREIATLL